MISAIIIIQKADGVYRTSPICFPLSCSSTAFAYKFVFRAQAQQHEILTTRHEFNLTILWKINIFQSIQSCNPISLYSRLFFFNVSQPCSLSSRKLLYVTEISTKSACVGLLCMYLCFFVWIAVSKKMKEERATCRDVHGTFVIIMMMIIVFSTILHARVPKWVGSDTRKGKI